MCDNQKSIDTASQLASQRQFGVSRLFCVAGLGMTWELERPLYNDGS